MQTHVHKGQCMHMMEGMKEDLLELDIGVAQGFEGLRDEHKKCLGEVCDDKFGGQGVQSQPSLQKLF